MNERDKLQLQQMIRANDVEDQTGKIRELKHSSIIKIEASKLARYAFSNKDIKSINPDIFNKKCIEEAKFLYDNYTDIFNKIKNNEISLSILGRFLDILGKIENEQIDQHEGSFEVGKILKELYVDSALRKAEILDNEHPQEPKKVACNNISWSTFKKMNN